MPATGKEAVSLKQAKAMYWKITNDLTNQTNSKIKSAVANKLDAADLVAGANITITPDPESGHVTIAANIPNTSAFVTKTAADSPEIPEINLAADAEAKSFLGY